MNTARLTTLDKQLDAAEIDILTDVDEMSFFLLVDSSSFVNVLERIYEVEYLVRLIGDKPSLKLNEQVIKNGYRNRTRKNGYMCLGTELTIKM